uniref:Uncharacterized protein n=1 Tax=Setaria italica TaxID=4555 RepID=K3ZYZ1_SETIT
MRSYLSVLPTFLVASAFCILADGVHSLDVLLVALVVVRQLSLSLHLHLFLTSVTM